MVARITGFLFSCAFSLIGAWLGWLAAGPWVRYLGNVLKNVPEGARAITLTEGFRTFNVYAFALVGLLVGFIFASVLFRTLLHLGQNLERIPAQDKASGVLGSLIGTALTAGLGTLIWRIEHVGPVLTLVAGIVFFYLGITIALSMKGELYFFFPGLRSREAPVVEEAPTGRPKLLDTNVIIDGRVADVFHTGFVEGPVFIPGFVLEELHLIADSPDSLKRNRGRRGLDILNQMQKELKMLVRVYDHYPISFSANEGVDVKLVRLAKEIEGSIVTNDFNLNKVAQLQGVPVLNVNELANAVKPVVLPGEEMTVTIVREGKELNQGVAYLDDGTMVVVEAGKAHIGEIVTVTVTTVLQTVAGKMIFTNLKSNGEQSTEEAAAERGVRAYRGGGFRKKTRTP